MRKIKLKFNSTKLKALFLCAVASVGLFYSCNQDDLHHHNHEHQSNFSAKKLSPEEALQVARKLNGLVNNGKHNTLLISEQSLSVANNSVDFSTVNLIESINGTKTYAFAVNDSNLEDNIIKNVILQEFQNEIVVKEVSYNMTDSFKQQYYNGATDFKSFQGTVTFETVFGNPCPDDADPVSIGIPVGDDNDGNGGSGYGGYIPIGGFPDGGINNGGLFNSIGGGGSGGGGGGYAYLQCTNCSRTYTSRSEMDGSICAGYNYIIVISFNQNQNVVPNNSPCDPSTTLPIAEQEFFFKARDFQRNLTPEQRTWTQQNPTSYTQILNYLRNENWSNESETFVEELMDYLISNPAMSWEIVMNNRTSFDTNEGEVDNYNQGGYDTTAYPTFNPQQQAWPSILPVIPQNKFVGWNRRLHPNWHCMDYSKEQLRVMGYQISSYYSTGQTFQIYTTQNGVNNNMLSQGLSYLKYALSNGIPVIVGVDDAPGHPGNIDNSTDHFIVIVGMGTDSNGKYFQFYDNASGEVSQGASTLNKLYYNSTTGIISGSSQCIDYVNTTEYPYRVTMIRKSKSL